MATPLSDLVTGAPAAPASTLRAGDDWFAQQGAGASTPGMAERWTPPGASPGSLATAAPSPSPAPAAPSDATAQQVFNQLFPGETLTPEDLAAHRAELEAAGFKLNPNASGRITDLTLPSGATVDPIYGAGSGINKKQWLVNTPGGGAGAGGTGAFGTGVDYAGLRTLLGPGGQAALEASPGYQFRLGQGAQALQRSAAAKGTLLTGGTLKGLDRYAQDYASDEYGNRVNQLMGLAHLDLGAQQQRYGQLLGLSQLGVNAAGGAANAGSSYANQAGDLNTQIGNAQAAGTVGAANAYQAPIAQGTNLAQMYLLSQMMKPTSNTTMPNSTFGPYATGYQYQ